MSQDFVSATITRGPASWASIYMALGFTLSIEGTTISMIAPLKYPWNIVAYAMVAACTAALFLNSGWFQNKLLGWMGKYERRAR
jgi:hypothetical protein